MGIPAKSNVHIELNDTDSIEVLNNAVETIIQFLHDANNGKLKGEYKGEYNIKINDDPYSNFISFEVNSGRVQNLDWQLNKIKDFVYGIKSVQLMDADMWVLRDGVFFDKSEE